MKKLLFCIALTIVAISVNGQSTAVFSYQAILNDANGTIKANSPAAVKFEILQVQHMELKKSLQRMTKL